MGEMPGGGSDPMICWLFFPTSALQHSCSVHALSSHSALVVSVAHHYLDVARCAECVWFDRINWCAWLHDACCMNLGYIYISHSYVSRNLK